MRGNSKLEMLLQRICIVIAFSETGPNENGAKWKWGHVNQGGSKWPIIGNSPCSSKKGGKENPETSQAITSRGFQTTYHQLSEIYTRGLPAQGTVSHFSETKMWFSFNGKLCNSGIWMSEVGQICCTDAWKSKCWIFNWSRCSKSFEITNAGFSTRSSVTNKPLHALIHIFQDNIGPSTDFSDDTFSFVQQICPLQHFFNSSILRNNPGSHCCLSQN